MSKINIELIRLVQDSKQKIEYYESVNSLGYYIEHGMSEQSHVNRVLQ